MATQRTLIPILIALLALTGIASPPIRTQPAPARDRLLTSALVGTPVAAGRYIFWKERGAEQVALYGYDLATSTRFLLAQPADATATIASDGTIVAWTSGDQAGPALAIHGYDLRTRAAFTLATGIGGTGEIAIDQGWLYYIDSALAHRGLFAREIASGHEQRVSSAGRRPVAADGALLWSEETSAGVGQTASWSLHLRTRDGRHNDTLIVAGAAGYGGFSGYA